MLGISILGCLPDAFWASTNTGTARVSRRATSNWRFMFLVAPRSFFRTGYGPSARRARTPNRSQGHGIIRRKRHRFQAFDRARRSCGRGPGGVRLTGPLNHLQSMQKPIPSSPGSAPFPADLPLSPGELERYRRQMVLPEVGFEGQARLREARILLVGAGGLGAPVALYLAAAGVGHITIVDDDHVDVTNLQRQVIFTASDVGRPKAMAAAERLAALNPHVGVVSHMLRLTRANAVELLDGHHVVVDGSDNFTTRYLINDTCVALGIPHVHGSVLRFEGQVSLF